VQFNAPVTLTTLANSGKIWIVKTVNVNSVTLTGGAFIGVGTLSTTSFQVGAAKSGNLNSIIAANVVVSSKAVIATAGVYLLFADGGIFQILLDAVLTVTQPTNFGVQSGSPIISIQGDFFLSSTLTSNVNVAGSGSLTVSSGVLHQQGASSISLASLTVAKGAWALLDTITATFKQTVGGGNVNITALPNPASTLGLVSLNLLHFLNGPVTVSGGVSIGYLQISEGVVNWASLKNNSVSTFLFEGGALHGSGGLVNIPVNSLTLSSDEPKTLDTVTITAKNLIFNCGNGTCTVNLEHGSSIVVGL